MSDRWVFAACSLFFAGMLIWGVRSGDILVGRMGLKANRKREPYLFAFGCIALAFMAAVSAWAAIVAA